MNVAKCDGIWGFVPINPTIPIKYENHKKRIHFN